VPTIKTHMQCLRKSPSGNADGTGYIHELCECERLITIAFASPLRSFPNMICVGL
jgi:hypothetical protein